MRRRRLVELRYDGDAGSGVFLVGHIWLLFVLFQLARGTRRGRNPGTKKARRFDALIAKML